MGAFLNYQAVLDDHDAVGILYCGKPVGDHDGGPALGQLFETFLDALFRYGVKS